jgi:hypothetical protein
MRRRKEKKKMPNYNTGAGNYIICGSDVADKLQSLQSNTTATSILPMAFRVMASTVASDLVSVQPLPLPTGLLAYIDFDFKKIHKFKIFYLSNDDLEKTIEVEANDLDEAISKIEDFAEIKFHIDYGAVEAD